MKLKNNNEDPATDEVIKLLEASGISLTDKEKELIRKTRQDERHARESVPAEQQLRQLCRLGYAGSALLPRSLVAYLAVCRKNAQKPRPTIDYDEIYARRKY